MPIHINLLAEAQAAEEMRRRDPVKWSIFAGVCLAVIFIAWGFFVEAQVLLADAQIKGVQQKIDSLTNNFQTATANLKAITIAKSKIDALDKLQQARFLQGNLMEALQHATVDGVQLTSVRLSQNYSTVQHSVGDKPGPTMCVEDINLRLGARDFSANPGDQVNKFTETLARNSYFQTMLKTNTVRLAGTPMAGTGDNGAHYVTFAVECKFPTQTR